MKIRFKTILWSRVELLKVYGIGLVKTRLGIELNLHWGEKTYRLEVLNEKL